MVVHCSAGIGRTGTFCALDICLSQLQDVGSLNVCLTVRRMRTQRAFSIQTPDQYYFCYNAILEHAQRQGLLPSNQWAGVPWTPNPTHETSDFWINLLTPRGVVRPTCAPGTFHFLTEASFWDCSLFVSQTETRQWQKVFMLCFNMTTYSLKLCQFVFPSHLRKNVAGKPNCSSSIMQSHG